MICAVCEKKILLPIFKNDHYFFCQKHRAFRINDKTVNFLATRSHTCLEIDNIIKISNALRERGLLNYIKTDMELIDNKVESTLSIIILKSQLKVIGRFVSSIISIS